MSLSPEERILIDGCRNGDQQAWLALYRAYAGDIGLFLKGMLRNSPDIDDLVQKVFLEFLSSLVRFRGDAKIRTWLHRIARHVALREIRSHGRRMRHVHEYAQTRMDEAASVENQAEARSRLTQIQGLLAELEEDFREVWILRELSGLSVAETSAVLEVKEATVRTRHHRARRQIQALLHRLDEQERALLEQRAKPLKLVSSDGGAS